jgi:hypothetical protein
MADRRTALPRKRHRPEEIVAKLRQVDVMVSVRKSRPEATPQPKAANADKRSRGLARGNP